ncbi:MAG TPA: hypothetical protein VMK12_14695, partial [Anaeromyxobacteraceae bacterium]|nr:hypothetical protein [Anaeromyxobacteraceae bacterium]
CGGCGADLLSREQREFDESFFAARKAEAEREALAEAERQEARSRAEREEQSARRAMGEELAREVGESERRRLGMFYGGGFLSGYSPLGLRLGGWLPGERLPPLLFGAAVILGLGLLADGVAAHSPGRILSGLALLLGMLIHVPL